MLSNNNYDNNVQRFNNFLYLLLHHLNLETFMALFKFILLIYLLTYILKNPKRDQYNAIPAFLAIGF